ncbi:hypothetical protein [Clostridium sp.]|uniref:hypothetical protein n=1 Tax=Clostridium sp. TaxID=1506 RepID=UPI0026359D2B|nr:hypothetical protein [Clostridium sp.]
MHNIKRNNTLKKGKLRKLKMTYDFSLFKTTYMIEKWFLIIMFLILSFLLVKVFAGTLVDLLKLSKVHSYILYIISMILVFYSIYEINIMATKIKYSRKLFGSLGERDYLKKEKLDLSNKNYIKVYSDKVSYKIQYYGLTEVKIVGRKISINYMKNGKKGLIFFKPGDENIKGIMNLINKNWERSIKNEG